MASIYDWCFFFIDMHCTIFLIDIQYLFISVTTLILWAWGGKKFSSSLFNRNYRKIFTKLKAQIAPFLWPFFNFPFIFVYFKMISRGREQQADRLCEFKRSGRQVPRNWGSKAQWSVVQAKKPEKERVSPWESRHLRTRHPHVHRKLRPMTDGVEVHRYRISA